MDKEEKKHIGCGLGWRGAVNPGVGVGVFMVIIWLCLFITRLVTEPGVEAERKYLETKQRYDQMGSPPVVSPENTNQNQ